MNDSKGRKEKKRRGAYVCCGREWTNRSRCGSGTAAVRQPALCGGECMSSSAPSLLGNKNSMINVELSSVGLP